MKLLVNESNSGIRLPRADGGTLKLRPKGQPGDRQDIDDKTAASEPVQRFLSAKKVSLLSAEEASTRAAAEDQAKKKKAPVAKKEASPAPSPKKEEPKPEPKPVVEEPKEEAPVLVPYPVEEKKDDDKDESSFKGKSKKKNRR
jgi:hypothetical protein